jgi:hypothetical protein
VEGASDQEIVSKVLELLGHPSPTIKVLAARGVDTVRDAVESVKRASIPLVVNDSPYAARIVALIDQPKDPGSANMKKLQGDLQDRLFVLDKPSIEEYLPAQLYEKAGRSRDGDLAKLGQLRSDRTAQTELKREISRALADVLTEDDFESIPTIVEAVRRAIEGAA